MRCVGLSCIAADGGRASAGALHDEGLRVLRLLNERFGSGKLEIAAEAGGRPFFIDWHADFNISHSYDIIAVAYSPEKSAVTGLPLRTGVDVQYIDKRKNSRGIAGRAFSSEEREYLDTALDADAYTRRFYQIWVLKECFLKAYGLSVFDMHSLPPFASRAGLAVQNAVALDFYLYEIGGMEARYMLAAAYERTNAAAVPEICYFSETPPLRSVPASLKRRR
jgi:phosphopantetheinyl transferase